MLVMYTWLHATCVHPAVGHSWLVLHHVGGGGGSLYYIYIYLFQDLFNTSRVTGVGSKPHQQYVVSIGC